MSTNDPKPENRPVDPEQQQPETPPPISYEAAARGAEEAEAARASGTEEGEQLADAIDQRMYFGGPGDEPDSAADAASAPPAGDPFEEADAAAAGRQGVPFPAGTAETVIDESPETPATVDPASARDAATTGTGSSIAIGCIAAAIVVVLIAVLVLTVIS